MLRFNRLSKVIGLLTTLLLATSGATVFAASDKARMSDRVAGLAQSGKPEMVDVIVQYKAMPDQAQAKRATGLGGETYRAYGRLPMRAMRIPAQALNALANSKGVKFVSVDGAVESFTEAARLTANEPVGTNQNSVFTGSGAGVAVIDSGVMTHADQNRFMWQYSFLDGAFNTPVLTNGGINTYNDQPLSDSFGHGTHIAGIIAGDGRESDG